MLLVCLHGQMERRNEYTMQRLFLIICAMLFLAACGGTSANNAASTDHSSTGHAAPTADHGAMGHGSSDAPYDAQFIDGMIAHHEGAIAMAKDAMGQAEHAELKAMADAIVTAQQQEIDQMRQWRSAWYPDLAVTSGMAMDMGPMEVSSDTSLPFDQRFITAMIAHHEGALAMAKDAQQRAEHAEIKTLAGQIIAAQEQEIAQMRQWEQQWFGK